MSGNPVSSRIGLELAPLDTLFFRDGRPFDGTPRAMSGLPLPQTLAGALRTWLLTAAQCDFEKLGASMRNGATFVAACQEQPVHVQAVAELRFRGPWFVHEGRPVVPMPATLRRCKNSDGLMRLAPLKDDLPGWRPPQPALRPLWCRDLRVSEAAEGYLSFDGLARFLANEVPLGSDVIAAEDLYGFDRRTGIVVGPETGAAMEGEIYGVSFLVPKPGVTLYAEIVGSDAALNRIPMTEVVIPFGGEGRHVVVRRQTAVAWPAVAPEVRNDGRTIMLLTTPGLFDGGWKPAALTPLTAAVPGYVAVSGWDLARGGPKANRFAAAAGSVFFFDQPMALRSNAGSLCAGEDAGLGWGCYVEGTWNYA